QWRTLTGEEGRGHACADGRQEPNYKLEGLRIEVLEDREMSKQGTECGLQRISIDVGQLLHEQGAPHGAVRIPEQFDDPLGVWVLQRPGNPAGPAVTDNIELQHPIEAQVLVDSGVPDYAAEFNIHCLIERVTDMSFQQAREVASQQVMAVERADASHEVGGGGHREDAVARFTRAGTAELGETGRQQFLEHVGNKQVGLDTGPVTVRTLCPVQSLDVLQVGQACPRRQRLPLGVPPGHVLEAVCLLVESGFLPRPWLVPNVVSAHMGCRGKNPILFRQLPPSPCSWNPESRRSLKI